jgi:hypothetical protein
MSDHCKIRNGTATSQKHGKVSLNMYEIWNRFVKQRTNFVACITDRLTVSYIYRVEGLTVAPPVASCSPGTAA